MGDKVKENTVNKKRGFRKSRTGFVVSDKMVGTVVVAIENRYTHRAYKKPVKKTVKIKASKEKFDVKTGDLVKIGETRPLSKTKHFRVTEIIQKAK
jgi:small subunit ribosomal protein S17